MKFESPSQHNPRKNHSFATIIVSLMVLIPFTSRAQTSTLVTGKSITLPPLGVQHNVGSLPMNIVLSPDGKFAVTSDMGFHESLWSIDAKTGTGVSHVDYPNDVIGSNGLYYGLAFGDDGLLFAAQGNLDTIDVLQLSDTGGLTHVRSIPTQAADFPSGLATDKHGHLYVANNDPSTFLAPSSIAIYAQSDGTELGRYLFASSFGGTPNFPLAIAALADGSKLYVASERDGVVYVLDTTDPTKPSLKATIATGANPDGLLLNKAQSLLFVANAGSDTVSVIGTSLDKVLSTTLLRPERLKRVAGATPTGLGLSPDDSTLYVTLGDMNAVAVLGLKHVSELELEGYIPTGWYPSGVVVSGDGKNLLFTNAKGTTTRYPNPGYVQYEFNSNPDYVQNLIEGNASTVPVPDKKTLSKWTKLVLENNGIGDNNNDLDVVAIADHRLDSIGLKAGKIKHVIYIVKENRTYDQVLGDLAQGNGDPSLVLFGPDVTPNQHALAQRFVLLDNFYTPGEVSGDGWPWSTQSMANENVIKNLPYNYSGRGRNYDFEGQNNGYLVGGFPATDPDGKLLSVLYPNGAPAIPDVAESPGSHIWDAAQKQKLAYRNYGFFYSFGVSDSSGNPLMPDNYPSSKGIQPPNHDLGGMSDFDYRRYDNDYADSNAPSQYGCLYKTAAYGKYSMPSRFAEWLREFQLALAKDPSGNSVPHLMTVRFNHDHTQGLTPGKFTPRAEVADNDYAVGQLVEAISHSPIWESTAIFVVEDDSQDGPDHVDAHRSTAYVISPWITQDSVDHRFYNTDSILKTIELILGIPPLSSYDAIATPILAWDHKPSNNETFTSLLPAQEIICEQTPALASVKPSSPLHRLMLKSASMNFDRPDSAPAGMLNEIVWKSVKGVDSNPPATRHSSLFERDSD